MSDPRSNLWDVANKILSVVNQMERNTAKQPPSQRYSLMQHSHEGKYHPQCKYRKHQGQYCQFKRKYHEHQGRHHYFAYIVSSTAFPPVQKKFPFDQKFE